MASISKILIWFVLVVVVVCFPFEDDPTLLECENMVPTAIRALPQDTSNRAFRVRVGDTIYHSTKIKVTIERNSSYPIRGLMLQARRAKCDHKEQSKPIGRFMIPQHSALKLVNCSGKENTVINKRWMSVFDNIHIEWDSINEDYAHIYFIATVAASKTLYWKDITSDIIRHSSDTEHSGELCPTSNKFRNGSPVKNIVITVLLLALVVYHVTVNKILV